MRPCNSLKSSSNFAVVAAAAEVAAALVVINEGTAGAAVLELHNKLSRQQKPRKHLPEVIVDSDKYLSEDLLSQC